MNTNPIIEKNAEDRELQLADALSAHGSLRESITSKFGLDPDSIDWKKAPRTKGFFSKLEEATGEKLKEGIGNSSSSLGQLLRYGVQNFMFDAYKDVPVIYPDLVSMRPSSNRQEWYAPLYGAELPLDVAPGGKFEDSRIQGLDTVVINKKIGRVVSMERELFDDDQTGQLVDRAGRIGKRARYKEEFDVMATVRGGAYSLALGNAFAANTALSQLALENADIALHAIRDPLGNRMLVMPGYLLVSTSDKFNAAKLLNSSLQPSIPGASGETISSAASGGTGWTMTVNPLQGLYQLGVSRFLGAGDWFLLEPKTSLVWQERDPLEILQEAPNSGASFENDEYRFRIRRRYQSALLESRYIFKGFINATAPII